MARIDVYVLTLFRKGHLDVGETHLDVTVSLMRASLKLCDVRIEADGRQRIPWAWEPCFEWWRTCATGV